MMFLSNHLWTVLLVATMTWIIGCASQTPVKEPTAEEQFKTLADEKKARLTSLVQSNKSKLSAYKATINDETDIQLKSEHPYVGKIEFTYAITPPKGELEMRHLATVSVDYQFSTKESKWILLGFNGTGGDLLVPSEARLVKLPDVKKVFTE